MLIFTKGLLSDLHLPSIGGSASFTSSSAEALTSSRHTFSLHFSFSPFLHFLTTRATFCLINDLSGRFFTTEETGESVTLLRSMSNKFPKKQHRFFFTKRGKNTSRKCFLFLFYCWCVWRIKTKRYEKTVRYKPKYSLEGSDAYGFERALISSAFTYGQIVNEHLLKSNDAEVSGLALH